jgi:aspartate/methionine/tyrosine aminotransferase
VTPPSPAALNPLARALEERLEAAAPEVLALLSQLGRRLFFPRGILTQTAEARQRAKRFNATIGIATQGGKPMFLPSVQRHLLGIEPADAVDYAPPAGRQSLRERWREKLLAENPSLAGKRLSLPITTAGITHGLSLVGDLFVDPGDVVVLPDKFWDNYALTFEVRLGARLETFPFYAGGGFDVEGFARALEEQGRRREKLVALLNFPNNPTGYMPTAAEGQALALALVRQAQRGTRLVAVFDDAYTGLFYHLGGPSMTESPFGAAVNRHPNLLAVRLDGATKELFAWGLRCGFLTFGPGRAETADVVAEVLETKVRGAIRSSISNVSQLSQSLVESALGSPSLEAERKEKLELLRERAERTHRAAARPRFRESFEPYPFNSGYFMCVRVQGLQAEPVRRQLLERGIGLIAAGGSDLRIAFSCLEQDEIEPLFEAIHEVVQELRAN